MIDIAIDAARKGGQLAYSYFKKVPKVSYKADNSPVTIADKNTEKLIRKIITKNFPDHGIIGEELKNTNPKAKYQWLLDPIDGTRDFVRGLPFWCTLVAVLQNGKPIIGICFFPTENETFTAEIGKGTYLNGKKTHVSKISDFKTAYITQASANYFEAHNKLKQSIKLSKAAGASRYFSTYGYNLLWKGKIEAFVGAAGGSWDFAAPAIITEEAGGKFSDFNGDYRFDSHCGVFTNGQIHQQILKILNE